MDAARNSFSVDAAGARPAREERARPAEAVARREAAAGRLREHLAEQQVAHAAQQARRRGGRLHPLQARADRRRWQWRDQRRGGQEVPGGRAGRHQPNAGAVPEQRHRQRTDPFVRDAGAADHCRAVRRVVRRLFAMGHRSPATFRRLQRLQPGVPHDDAGDGLRLLAAMFYSLRIYTVLTVWSSPSNESLPLVRTLVDATLAHPAHSSTCKCGFSRSRRLRSICSIRAFCS